jgi:Fur family transcriptional regulator, peroxide stress response regulator
MDKGQPYNAMQDNPLIDGLRAAGAKMTAQRLAICRWLHGNDSHPTAADVYQALRGDFPTMSLATVYNTLSLLAELDLIHEVAKAEDGSSRFDPNTAPHLNLICTHCQQIIDVEDVDLSHVEQLPPLYGFAVADINVLVHGLCANCQQQLTGDR